ncbi:glycosyltransferase family 4 protein [Pontiellaceae bacterium B12227]|nr:glycosyltransferase family 4 protein [Pontiellaceae bacterium B12227]
MPQLKKVVHVMRRFVPGKWGGTECVVFNTSRELIRRGAECPVFCTDMLAERGRHCLEEVPVYRFSYCFPWFFLSSAARQKLVLKGGSPLSLSLFFALLREKDISIIHTHVQHRLGGMARTVARLKKIPYVVSLHGGHFTLPPEQVEKMTAPFRGRPEWGKAFGALFGSRQVLDDADAIICVGQSECDEVRKRYPDKAVHYIPNGVDVDRFAEAEGELFRNKYGFQPLEKLVLCVSRIDYQKNQLGLVRAFADFSARQPAHRLVLIGPVTVESYRDEIKAEVVKLGLQDKVTLIEGLPPDSPLLPSAYKAAEIFVLPSLHEPFGIVVLEAWAAGLPVVASRVGGIPGFAVDGETILMAEPGTDDEFAAQMSLLANNVALRADLSRRAFGEVATHYSWPKIVDQVCAVYENCMK